MLPEIILNEKYELSEEYVIQQINSYDFRGDKGFEVCRISGYRYLARDTNTEIIAWQCNMADIQNYDIKLPTIIRLQVDSNNIIKFISLNENFKGSQGIPCSWKYLEKRLKKLVGEQFNSNNVKINDALGTGCRHTYELLYGACVHREWCREKDISDTWVSEVTAAYENDNNIVAIDRISVGGNESITKINISDYKNNIKNNRLGAIEKCSNIKIQGYSISNGSENDIGNSKIMSAENVSEFKIKLMKILSKYWIYSGKKLDIKSKFYFSHLWPTTLFGILSQMFAITVYSKSYSYFQHCIQGLQKDENYCACIGVCSDIDECMRYFEDFDINDLF